MLNRIFLEIKKNKNGIFWTIIFVILFYLILPDKETIESTIEEIKGADLSWVILGNIIYYLTIPLYSIQIFVLSFKKINFWITYKVQMSVLFINKLLPSAVSSFVMNSFYLNRQGHKSSQVASIISMQAVTSSIPYTILLISSILIGITRYHLTEEVSFNLSGFDWQKLVLIGFSAVLIIAFVIYSSDIIKNFIKNSLESFWGQFKSYKNKPRDISWALATGFFAPLLGVLVLFTSGQALALDITFGQAFLIYALGTTMANLIPVPGGIGAAEAGLYAGFTFFGFPPAESWAAVLIYRITTFWIPTFPGFAFFINLRKNVLRGFSINWKMPDSKKKSIKA